MDRAYFVERAKNARERKLQKLNEIKSQPCVDCGGTFPPCAMDFDHITDDKVHNISWLINNRSWAAVEQEIAKCELVCANCHRVRTQDRMHAHWAMM